VEIEIGEKRKKREGKMRQTEGIECKEYHNICYDTAMT
jgi:hypothetical protein